MARRWRDSGGLRMTRKGPFKQNGGGDAAELCRGIEGPVENWRPRNNNSGCTSSSRGEGGRGGSPP